MDPDRTSPHAADFIRSFRKNYTNLYQAWAQGSSIPQGAVLRTPAEAPIDEAEMLADLRAWLGSYRKDHPHEHIELIKFMRLLNGSPILVIEDERGLPPEDRLLVLSQTLALNTSSRVDILTEILVGQRG